MARYKCDLCDYVYDEAVGDIAHNIPAGTAFASLPIDWVCPECGAPKEMFRLLQ